ncbi:monothiol glutaredoxin-S17 [Cryptomeria japonica]|uniref:monothiol glutaredoxin-S17 n=1 Tax=Cryptomeria japonica TaxID=3369 RepID=UPI0025AC00E3|nr:monothiol glutaredoxin-S17 [Cryptomeria japonica]
MGANVKDLQSKAELDVILSQGKPVILHFWAEWCEASKQMDQVFYHLCTDTPYANFLRVEAEQQPEISEAYSVSAVPFFVFFKDGKVVDTLEGANPSELANKVAKVSGSIDIAETDSPASLGMSASSTVIETVKQIYKLPQTAKTDIESGDAVKSKLQQLMNSKPVMLFMKGTPEEPRCGFSRKVVDVLKSEGVEYGSFDILSDEQVREGLKAFSNWPTFPQLYCKGELLGGCDITLELHESGELKQIFKDHGLLSTANKSGELTAKATSTEPKPDTVISESGNGGIADSTGISESLSSRIASIINSNPIMLFMKGTPEEPRCGFSRKAVEILREGGVEFGSFNILTDEEVRQGLKTYSNWSSYPQLYIKGELIGGSDIMIEMHKSGELKNIVLEKGVLPKESLDNRLKKLVNSSPIMLFMKGTPDAPRCGFSSKVVNALNEEGLDFGHFDILSDEEVRQGLKTYSNWPTFPQLYYKGELIGGCDIVLEMHKAGELKSSLTE